MDFEIENGVLVKYNGSDSEVIIPSGISHIGEKCFWFNETISHAVIPEGVEYIDSQAFGFCKKLNSIKFPDNSLISIGRYAFSGCESLTHVRIPESVTSIGDGAFVSCKKLVSINIPEQVTSIENSTFKDCETLVSIHIPENVTSIGNYAFEGCKAFRSLKLPDHLNYLGEGAFSQCDGLLDEQGFLIIRDTLYHVAKSLKEVKVPMGVKRISGAFMYSEIESVEVPFGVECVGEYSFCECHNLSKVILPTTVTEIGYSAFCECHSLTDIVLPNSVTRIGKFAFESCPLVAFTIPDGIFEIEQGTFRYCENLEVIHFSPQIKRIEENAFAFCKALRTVSLPNQLEYIGTFAFAECENLKYIEIPSEAAVDVWSFTNSSPEQIVVYGEGDENRIILDYLQRRLPETKVVWKQISHPVKPVIEQTESSTLCSYNDHISFSLPAEFKLIWEDRDDGTKQCKIVCGERIDDDGDTVYDFFAEIREDEVTGDEDDPIPAGEKPLETLHRRDPERRFLTVCENPSAEWQLKEMPVNIIGIQIKYYALMFMVQTESNRLATIQNLRVWKEEDTEENENAYAKMVTLAQSMRINGQAVPQNAVSASALLAQLSPDFDGRDSVIRGQIGLQMKYGDEVVSDDIVYGDDDGGVHIEGKETILRAGSHRFQYTEPAPYLYEHYGKLLNEANRFMGMGVQVVQNNGEEFEAIPLTRMLQNNGLNKTTIYRKLKEAEKADNYALDQTALTMAEVFRVNQSVFNSRHDDEGDIRERLMDKKWKLSALRSFAWTLTNLAQQENQSVDDYSYEDLLELCDFIEERGWLNYDADGSCDGLCSHPDIHVYYMPQHLIETGEAEEIREVMNPNQIVSLDDFRDELIKLQNPMILLHNGLLQNRDRDEKLDSTDAAVLQAWCTMAVAAKEPFFSEDGPMFYFHGYPKTESNQKPLPLVKHSANAIQDKRVEKRNDANGKATSATAPKITKGADQWERVTFGTYPVGKPISWLVLEKNEDNLLLLSEFALDAISYSGIGAGVKTANEWRYSYMRTWLNEDFFEQAFSVEEQALIIDDTHETYKKSQRSEEKTPDETDKVFLLSGREVAKFFPKERDRICKATDYAKRASSITIESGPDQCSWWLRSPAAEMIGLPNWATRIKANGEAEPWGIYSSEVGVRPVIRIKNQTPQEDTSLTKDTPSDNSNQTPADINKQLDSLINLIKTMTEVAKVDDKGKPWNERTTEERQTFIEQEIKLAQSWDTSDLSGGKKAQDYLSSISKSDALVRDEKTTPIRKYAWIGSILSDDMDQLEVERELEAMSDEEALQAITNYMLIKELRIECDRKQKESDELAKEIQELKDAEEKRRAEEEANKERIRRRVEARKEEERAQIREEIQRLNGEMSNVTGLFAGIKRNKLQKQIDDLMQRLKSIR